MNIAMNKIKKLMADVRAAEHKLHEAIEAHYRPGRFIEWERGVHCQHGCVLDVSGYRLKVRNEDSGKEYWISVWDDVQVRMNTKGGNDD